MDQSSVQHDHVVTIPREGVPIAVSPSAANTQGWSRAPRQQRSRWNNSCSWLTFDFCSTSIHTLLLVKFLSVFQDEHAHEKLQSLVFGWGLGRLVHCAYKLFRELQFNRLPQAVFVSPPGSEVGESRTGRRLRLKILLWLKCAFWRSLDGFLQLWIGVGLGIVYTSWKSKQTPHLNWLCTIFLVIAYFWSLLVVTVGSVLYVIDAMEWHKSTHTRLAPRSQGKCGDFATANVPISRPGF